MNKETLNSKEVELIKLYKELKPQVHYCPFVVFPNDVFGKGKKVSSKISNNEVREAISFHYQQKLYTT